jgi:hypothetical protein
MVTVVVLITNVDAIVVCLTDIKRLSDILIVQKMTKMKKDM